MTTQTERPITDINDADREAAAKFYGKDTMSRAVNVDKLALGLKWLMKGVGYEAEAKATGNPAGTKIEMALKMACKCEAEGFGIKLEAGKAM